MFRPKVVIMCMFFWALLMGAGEATLRRQTEPKKEVTAIVAVPVAGVFAKATERAERTTEVLLGDEFRVVKGKKGWLFGHIPSQKGYKGWIRKKNVCLPPKDSPYFQNKPLVHVKDAETSVLLGDGRSVTVYAGTRLPLVGMTEDLYEVAVSCDSTGRLPIRAAMVEDNDFGKDVVADDILNAIEFYGSNYRWGGLTTAGGLDCSGLVYMVYRINGIFLRRDSYMQAAEGMDVGVEELSKGDLLFFRTRGSRISHVGIYMGEDMFIHSSKSGNGVFISALSNDFYKKRFVKARRILLSR